MFVNKPQMPAKKGMPPDKDKAGDRNPNKPDTRKRMSSGEIEVDDATGALTKMEEKVFNPESKSFLISLSLSLSLSLSRAGGAPQELLLPGRARDDPVMDIVPSKSLSLSLCSLSLQDRVKRVFCSLKDVAEGTYHHDNLKP